MVGFAHPTVPIQFSNSGCKFAISRRVLARGLQIRVPRKNRGRRESRVLAAPIARVHWWKAHGSHHSLAESARLSPRNGFNGLLRALPGDHALLTPSPADNSAKLDVCVGAQDHTTSPYAAASSSSAEAPDAATFTASLAQRVVTIAKGPSCGRETGEVLEVICPTGKVEFYPSVDLSHLAFMRPDLARGPSFETRASALLRMRSVGR
jgi:hypothetical protein